MITPDSFFVLEQIDHVLPSTFSPKLMLEGAGAAVFLYSF
jgi:hypothetical protein